MKRRVLLSLLAAASASTALAGQSFGVARASNARSRHVFVLLELRGGNDGLNTVAPIRDPLYQKARPTLGLRDALPISDSLAIHPALAPLLPLWKSKRLSFVLGVGWPRPNRSHFKSADQWATASLSGEGPGWLASAFDQRQMNGPFVSLDPAGCRSMEGGNVLALQLSPAQLEMTNHRDWHVDRAGGNLVLRQMLMLEQAGQRELELLRQQLAPLPGGVEIPRGTLGQQVALALRLIGSPSCPPVLQLAQGGYDTHANQLVRHNRVLGDLAAALASFDAGLKSLSSRPKVTLLAVSEFGRRLHENGSRGSDHGSASIAFLYGDDIPHPFLGTYPNLNRLDERGDLIASISPPELYRTVLAHAISG